MENSLTPDFTLDRYGLHVRLVNEDDADFIVRLRTDEKLCRYINTTKPDIEVQKEWTRKYKEREQRGEDYYFLFEKPLGIPVGVCRIYDIQEDQYTVGSWLFSPDAPIGTSILADIITREIAYSMFPGKTLFFDVRKDNFNVLRYQSTFQPTELYRDELSIYYTQDPELFNKKKNIHLRMFAPKKQ